MTRGPMDFDDRDSSSQRELSGTSHFSSWFLT
jgi:hypothetical protein